MSMQTFKDKVSFIREAIKDGVAIVLEEYYSVKSRNASDRHVIPLKIKGDCVLCFDLDKNGDWRQFKFERIKGVKYA